MSPSKGPTLRAQWLGKLLREYREAAGLTLGEAGGYLQRDKATVSRIESGIIPCRAADALALLTLYGVNDPQVRDSMERLARDVWCKGWWDEYAPAATTRIIDHAWLEARARQIRLFHIAVVPGLLQNPDYAAAVMRIAAPDAAPEEIKRWVQFRMNRQRELERADPPRLHLILDQAVLCRGIPDRSAMRSQLLRLIDASTRPNITLQILPFSAGVHASPEGHFTIFDMPDPYPYLAQVETRSGAVYLEGEDVDGFARAYDYLQEAAVSPGESRTLIEASTQRLLE